MIEHGTLNAKQINNCIAIAEARDALEVEKARRKEWTATVANAESFKALCISGEHKDGTT
jgi:hypothetical protein